ncbi:enoyl-CoA hydratase/isomerase family protein [Mycobacterium timonense]|uniref:Enoyl-CoA hydratase n=1 Tax=Mycobacterium bouchedurhonense TaxID=701041 RepID=A0AAW5S045_MYCBC|nr:MULTISPECIES: enoyl-CoA hydratase-related protein [Mycobacterium avium complex (MAC)]MCA2292813.1 enoyl-CoA hydratase/isomerase family protein [Mycobacterium avium]MCV6988071.1 enoyl-CoA hydratase/isomerase family protein [Mycobacterium bouchedurhonense]MCV6995058.1 enoyl-CoA hydratase/isomerase family protein [Mycobacterium timonense]ORA44776.1 enoyl-CoA hydratase [Mycobacterium bouchedurhonense]
MSSTELGDEPASKKSNAAVLIEYPADGVTVLRLNRPQRLNAINSELIDCLLDAVDAVRRDRHCRAVVLTGAGRGFCAGADLEGYGTPRGWEDPRKLRLNYAVQEHLATAVTSLTDLHVPVIAAVNGPAAGGGMALAVAADMRIVSTRATFNVAFIKVGLSGCDLGLSWLLPRTVGTGRAFELMLTGRKVDADEAVRIGLANRVVAQDRLLDEALETAALIAANSPWGVRMTKQVMWSQLEVGSLRAGMELENRTQVLSTYTGDVAEAMEAFQERRPPEWA